VPLRALWQWKEQQISASESREGGARGSRAGIRGRRDGAVRRPDRAPEPPGFSGAVAEVGAGVRLRAARRTPHPLHGEHFHECPGLAARWRWGPL
jgi:hypothetical protein